MRSASAWAASLIACLSAATFSRYSLAFLYASRSLRMASETIPGGTLFVSSLHRSLSDASIPPAWPPGFAPPRKNPAPLRTTSAPEASPNASFAARNALASRSAADWRRSTAPHHSSVRLLSVSSNPSTASRTFAAARRPFRHGAFSCRPSASRIQRGSGGGSYARPNIPYVRL